MPENKDPKAEALVKRWRSRLSDLGPYFQHCEDLARVILPWRLGFTSQTFEGDRRSEDLYDGTGMQAARGLANAMDAMLWPEGEQSFFIEAVDDDLSTDDESKEWLADCETRMEEAFDNPRARFRQARGECNLDVVAFGGGALFMGEGKSLSHLLFQTVHPKDAVIVFDDEGNPNGLFRKITYTLRQAIQRFRVENLSEKLREKAALSEAQPDLLDAKYDFLHCVVERREAPKGSLLARNLPYADIWLEVEACKINQEGGYHEFPFACPRWDTSSGESTGRGPGMIALPDLNTLQAMDETLLIAGQRIAAPPLLVPNDGAFNPLTTEPDGLAYYDADLAKAMGRIPIAPLETGAKLPIVREMQDTKRNQVFAAFLRNVLNLPTDGPQMTAEEIRARIQETMREIGPPFGRFETDYKAPTTERPFMIMLRAGAFKPMPLQLANRQIRFRYSSPVKKLRKLMEAAAISALTREAGELAKLTGSPEPMDAIDIDAAIQFKAEASNVPSIVVRSPEKIAQMRQARQQAQEAQAQAVMAQTMADAAQKGSQAVKNLQPEPAAA